MALVSSLASPPGGANRAPKGDDTLVCPGTLLPVRSRVALGRCCAPLGLPMLRPSILVALRRMRTFALAAAFFFIFFSVSSPLFGVMRGLMSIWIMNARSRGKARILTDLAQPTFSSSPCRRPMRPCPSSWTWSRPGGWSGPLQGPLWSHRLEERGGSPEGLGPARPWPPYRKPSCLSATQPAGTSPSPRPPQ